MLPENGIINWKQYWSSSPSPVSWLLKTLLLLFLSGSYSQCARPNSATFDFPSESGKTEDNFSDGLISDLREARPVWNRHKTDQQVRGRVKWLSKTVTHRFFACPSYPSAFSSIPIVEGTRIKLISSGPGCRSWCSMSSFVINCRLAYIFS